jgi:hypothetical protein
MVLTLAAMSNIEQLYRGFPPRMKGCCVVEWTLWPQGSGIRKHSLAGAPRQSDLIFFEILRPVPPDTRGTMSGGAIVDSNSTDRKKKEPSQS